jgi:hypothetical protein
MIDYSMIYVYVLLALFLSVDVGLMMLANPTHIRIKGVICNIPVLTLMNYNVLCNCDLGW